MPTAIPINDKYLSSGCMALPKRGAASQEPVVLNAYRSGGPTADR
jgi:hypothetical protein